MIVVSYPHKSLWPNGRSHWAVKAREAKKLRHEAAWATKEAASLGAIRICDSPIPLHIICHPKSRGPVPDRDGIVSAAKSAIDGIADALGINDRHFQAPTVTVSDQRTGQFIITIGKGETP